jgi:hypothetical protein
LGTTTHVATMPAQLVRAPAGFGLYFRVLVPGAGATLVSLLPGGVLPTIPVANISGPAGLKYAFKFVDLQSEADPAAVAIRYTDDGQTAATATLGFVVPGQPAFVRIPCDAQDIYLISTGADQNIQVKLGIMGVTDGGN